jgi:hypothetical protein
VLHIVTLVVDIGMVVDIVGTVVDIGTMAGAMAGATTIGIIIGGMGYYYPNCDWVLNPYTNQWIWTC